MLLSPSASAFLDEHPVGALATVSAAGRPRQSTVYFARDGERLLISTVAGRTKANDVLRTGWASLCARGDAPPYPSVTVAGPADLIDRGIAELTALVAQRVAGLAAIPDPLPEADLVAQGRVILAIRIERVGPVNYVDAP